MKCLSNGLLALVLALPAPALAAGDEELKALREELRRLKESYEARISALEQRLEQAERQAERQTVARGEPTPAASRSALPPAANAFNPEISLILQGALTRQSRDPTTDEYRIQGFIKPQDAEGYGPPERRGFSIAESELVVAANVDPYFRGYLNLALSPDNDVEVEEAYVQTLGLGGGFTVKGGRFLSGVGYLNDIHPHAQDFADYPLAYTAMFANRLVAEGLQLKWVAPTDTFLEFGLEGGRDDNFPGSSRNKTGSALGAGFVHLGGDVGASHSWRAGVSFVATHPIDRPYDDTDSLGVPTLNTVSGTSRTTIADFVWKWAPEGNPVERNFKLQGEYFRRRESGTLTCADAGAPSLCTGGLAGDYRSTQSGFYLQGVWQPVRGWRAGYRYDRLNSGTPAIGLVASGALTAEDFAALLPYHPRRDTVMLDYSPTEFSRLRLQVARDRARFGEADNQLWLQYIMSLGSHGAHRF